MDSQQRSIKANFDLEAPGTTAAKGTSDPPTTNDGVDLSLRLGSIQSGQSANLVPHPDLRLSGPNTQGLNVQIGSANNDQRVTAEGGPTFYGGQLPLPSQVVTQLQNIISQCQAAAGFPGSSPPTVNIFINVSPSLPAPPQPAVLHAAPAPPALNDLNLNDISAVSATSGDHLTPGSSSSRKRCQRGRDLIDPYKRCGNVYCRTNNTPLWRKGPFGPKTLCNACGIKYRKHEKKWRASQEAEREQAERRRELSERLFPSNA